MQIDEKGAKKNKRSRYWSVMLVGDHGRVIPFRHFKALTIGVGIVLVLSLGALILLGLMYTHQRRQIASLEQNLAETRAQTVKFRDEKDLYLTQLIAQQKQAGELPQNPLAEKEALNGSPQSESKDQVEQKPEEIKKDPEIAKEAAPVQKAESQIKWSADIRNIDVTYDSRQQILKAVFRIYNTSRPKKTLTGRTVVVFKASDDPPIHWATVPSVPLRDGKPIGNNGKSFRVNNYRTETFKSLRRKNSAEFDIASVYIFTEQGELIANQELPFKVDYSPPEPVQPPSAPVEQKTPPVPDVRPSGPSEPTEKKPVDPTAPNPGDTTKEPPSLSPPPAAPVPSPGSAPPPETKAEEPQSGLKENSTTAPIGTESTRKIPAAEAEPAPEGGTK